MKLTNRVLKGSFHGDLENKIKQEVLLNLLVYYFFPKSHDSLFYIIILLCLYRRIRLFLVYSFKFEKKNLPKFKKY